MRKKIGIVCVILGVLCLFSSMGLLLYNRAEDRDGQQTAQTILQDAQKAISENLQQQQSQMPQPQEQLQETAPMPQSVRIEDADCIGILYIPVLELELPVLSDWDYGALKKAPCRYYGSCAEENLVIAAHNYQSHFGRLSELEPGDMITFTDVSGQCHGYEVILLETLNKEATEQMITSGFALSLYTCTPGGSNRVTVRCAAINE